MSEKENRGKTRRWLVPAAMAAVAAAAVCAGGYFATRPAPLPDPHEAVEAALDSLKPLPDPASLGVLGQGEWGGERFGVSGTLDLQTGEDGLSLRLADFTLGYEEGSTDLEVYINSKAAALKLPETTGETWYGVDMTRSLQTQAAELLGEETAAWYFGEGQLGGMDEEAATLGAALSEIRRLGLSEGEMGSLKAFFAQLDGQCRKQEDGEGYVLSFAATAERVEHLLNDYNWRVPFNTSEPAPAENALLITPRDAVFTLHVDGHQRLTYLEIVPDGAQEPFLMLELGDPDAPSPRLELNWGGGNALELAITVSEGEGMDVPAYENAFGLLIPAEP